MMTPLEKDNNNTYCVPAALSILTGLPVGDCVSMIREHLGDQAITGIFLPVALSILKGLGQQTSREDALDGVSLSLLGKHKGDYLISTGGHALVLRDGMIYDNQFQKGVSPKGYPGKRMKIQQAYRITNVR